MQVIRLSSAAANRQLARPATEWYHTLWQLVAAPCAKQACPGQSLAQACCSQPCKWRMSNVGEATVVHVMAAVQGLQRRRQQLDHLLVRYLLGCANNRLLLRKRELLIGAAPTAAFLHEM